MSSTLTSVLTEIAKEEDFCVPDEIKSERLRPLLKSLYDDATAATKRSFGPLPSLVVDGMDEESIWEQIQTRKTLTRFAEKKIKTINRKIEQQKQKLRAKKSVKIVEQSDDSEEESLGEEQEETDGDHSEDLEDHGVEEDEDMDLEEEEEEDEEQQDEDEEQEDKEEPEEDEKTREITKKWAADDFDDDVKMEAWLDAFEEDEHKHKERMEKKEKRAKASTVESREWDDEEEEEDDLEFIGNHLYEESDDEEEEDLDPRSIRYEDFFTSEPGSGKNKKAKKPVKKEVETDDEEEEDDDDEEGERESDEDMDDFDGPDDYEDSDGAEDDEEDEPEEDDLPPAKAAKKSKDSFDTTYQKRTRELTDQISELEKALMAEKSWELKGEVKGGNRPENSLLGVAVDVDRSVKVAPVITQDYTTSLEEKIIERIKAGRFDDPSPSNAARDGVVTDAFGPSEGDLSQEKSKVGLGELYAEEYAKKLDNTADTLNVQTQAARDEAINLYNAVARELDALTHFFFSPKPVAAEANAKVLATQRAMPALEMEDITPFNQNSTGSAVAPEQVLEKKRGKKVTLLTSAELTREDRKKLRRHKKAVRKAEKKEQEKDTSIKNLRKQAEKKLTEELKADKRVVLAQEGNKKAKHDDSNQYGKSSNFFSKLQQETQQQIASKASQSGSKRKREEETGGGKSSSGFKL